MTEIEKMVITTALRKMFTGNHFSICTVDHCLKIAGAIAPKADYNALSALHCIEWSEMPPELRDYVFATTLNLFTHTGFQLDQLMQLGACGQLKALQ